jgi:hypothetical protein
MRWPITRQGIGTASSTSFGNVRHAATGDSLQKQHSGGRNGTARADARRAIAAVDFIPESDGRETIDCSGLTIAPGFVDIQSYSEKEVLQHLSNKVQLLSTTHAFRSNAGAR